MAELLVCDPARRLVHQLTIDGVIIKSFRASIPYCVAAHADLVAIGTYGSATSVEIHSTTALLAVSGERIRVTIIVFVPMKRAK